jgi:hypothetical protein
MFSSITNLFGSSSTSEADKASSASQITTLNRNFTGMKGALSTSLTSLEATPGVRDAIDTSMLTTALSKVEQLEEICKNISTEECEARQARLQAENDAKQLKFYQDELVKMTKDLTIVRNSAQAKLDEYLTAKASNPVFKGESMIPKVEELISKIDGDIAVVRKSVPYIDPPQTTSFLGASSSGSSGSSSGSTRPPYALPSIKSHISYQSDLDAIKLQYNSLMGVPVSEADQREFWVNWLRYTFIPILFYSSILYAAVIGGTTCANIYGEEKSMLNRLYYFFYGMLGFPFVLAYAAVYIDTPLLKMINTPFWTSFIPVSPRLSIDDMTTQPTTIEVVNGKFTKTTNGMPAPAGMTWIKKLPTATMFTYLLSVNNTTVPVEDLPLLTGGLQWASMAAATKKSKINTPQTLWYVQEVPVEPVKPVKPVKA